MGILPWLILFLEILILWMRLGQVLLGLVLPLELLGVLALGLERWVRP